MPVLVLLTYLLGSFFNINQATGNSTNDPDSKTAIVYHYGTVVNPVMKAIRVEEDQLIVIDGINNEPVWERAHVATQFTQRYPNDGVPATEQTEVRVFYTDQALYVSFMAYDSSPDSITAPLFRRDGNQPSDWVYVTIDSYNDKRTGFAFAVNPKGVQKDVLYYDDSNEDVRWDAVWEARTQIHDNGWSAEFRIPHSQLRFSTSEEHQKWGINFQRRIARKGEIAFWAPSSQADNRLVSRFGELQGLSGIKKPHRLEIKPYAAGSLLRAPNSGTGNPYYRANDVNSNVGGDITYGITSDLTLTATINPDFGQVEADPAVINLTANENFFAERRPFFLEGNDIFNFGDVKTYTSYGTPSTFYSRRIGRSPQGNASRAGINASHFDQPDFTRIAAAVKLSGKTRSGWSVGMMDAITRREFGHYELEDGTSGRIPVEPASNYMMLRLKKDYNGGNTFIGGFASSVNRDLNGNYFENYLHSAAYTSGLDFHHNFMDRSWVASGMLAFSHVAGSAAAIERTQRSPVRFFNRVDANKLSVDAGKTALSGFATEWSIQKQGGENNWLGSFTYSEVSPGYEVNDLGFGNRSDYRAFQGVLVYREIKPVFLQYYEWWVFHGRTWNYDGDNIGNGLAAGGMVRFKNQWSSNVSINYNAPQYLDRLTRGGPVMYRPTAYSYNVNIRTNQNKKTFFYTGTFQRKGPGEDYHTSFWTGVSYAPTPWLQLNLDPEVNFSRNTAQYVTTVTDPSAIQTFGSRYVFSDIRQTTTMMNIKLNWTFTRNLSLETFVRPFIASGSYTGFKELAQPRTFDFNVYGTDTGTITETDNVYSIDPDGTGNAVFTIANPDFNFRSVQGNAVLRWEYLPGSTLFLVWQQQRNDFEGVGDFNFNRDLSGLFRSRPTNVFLIKLSYWFGA